MRHALLLLLAITACRAGEAAAPPPAAAEVVIANDLVRVSISPGKRASISQVMLLDTKPIVLPRHARGGPNALPDEPLPVLRDFSKGSKHNLIYSQAGIEDGLTDAPWQVAEKGADHASFSFVGSNGLDWRLSYRLSPKSLEIGVSLSVSNRGEQPRPLQLIVLPVVGVHGDYARSEIGYQSVFTHRGGIAGSIVNHGMPDLPVPNQQAAPIQLGDGGSTDFLGVKSRFFAAWWKPQSDTVAAPVPAPAPAAVAQPGVDTAVQPGAAAPAAPASADWAAMGGGFLGADGVQQAWVRVHYAKTEIPPGGSWRRSWSITAACMAKQHLALVPEVEQTIKYTDGYYRFFKLLANAMTFVLDLLARVVQHYGVAVIILTILIKAALYRTTFKQQESMLKMQKVAPELKYLQEQYKNNKQMLAQKQMELFRKHGVNPLGGCLPILIQLPIFIALFQAFSHSADLRGASFLWIPDLTLPDQTFGLQTTWWPLWGGVISLNILPILYILVSAWMSFSQTPPANADPQQEMMYKMMRWLPIVFGVIFYDMPSGLVLYFTVQAVISTLELKYIKKKLGMK